ncbi:hypothetical protein YC2023_030223 [Brassica napus]
MVIHRWNLGSSKMDVKRHSEDCFDKFSFNLCFKSAKRFNSYMRNQTSIEWCGGFD